jgi:hypothetical protein
MDPKSTHERMVVSAIPPGIQPTAARAKSINLPESLPRAMRFPERTKNGIERIACVSASDRIRSTRIVKSEGASMLSLQNRKHAMTTAPITQ